MMGRQRGERHDHARSPVSEVLLVGGVLIAKPQRRPGAIRPLVFVQELERGTDGISRGLSRRGYVVEPHQPGLEGVGRDIGAAPIKRQRTPAAAKRRHTPIGILEIY